MKKTLLSLLGTWATKYKHESGMRSLADLYELGVNNGRRVSVNIAHHGNT